MSGFGKNSNGKLKPFLEQFKRTQEEKDKKIGPTHTWLLGNQTCTYNIPEEHYDELYDLLYHDAFILGVETHLVERFRDPSILRVDFDFVFEQQTSTRKYTENDLKDIVKIYNKVITTLMDIPTHKLKAYIFERTRGYHDKGKFKDGFHMMYPDILVTCRMQRIIRLKVLDKVRSIFERLNLKEPDDKVIDESIIDSNGWMMYGTNKSARKPYLLTHIYDMHLEDEFDPNNLDNRKLIEYFSIHNTEDKEVFEIRDKYKELLESLGLSRDEKKKKGDEKSGKNRKKRTKGKFRMNKRANREDLDIIRKYVSILDPFRADDHKNWIDVGYCLHNIDDDLLDSWIEFSKKSPKFIPGECEEKWQEFTDDPGEKRPIGIGSLHHFAQLDDPVGYETIKRGSLSKFLELSMNGSTNAVANVVYEMYKYHYVCTSRKHSTWYEFRNHRWHEIEKGIYLEAKLSNEVLNEYLALNQMYLDQGMQVNDEGKEPYIQRVKKLCDVTMKLQDINFKEKVMKECAVKFYDPYFFEKLDTNKDLLGFENGVLNLATKEFRSGCPEDYISLSTGIDYVDYDKEGLGEVAELMKEIDDYFSQVFPIENVREYVWRCLASFLQGANPDQKLHIWTGCHAKDTEILMFDGTKKLVQDIKVGEQLMGDDSTPRNVERLARGHSDMYKIVPIKGEPYVVNGDHILCLKATTIGAICYSEKEHRWKANWQERDEKGYPTVKSKNFPHKFDGKQRYVNNVTYYEDKEEAHRACLEFFQYQKYNNKNFIHNNDVIEIPVREYLKIRTKVGARNYYAYRNLVDYQAQEVPFDPYMLGYWLGDGHSPEHNLYDNKHIPLVYKANSREVRMQVLAGILDSDGTYQKHTNQYLLTLKSEAIINDVQDLCRSLGFACYKKPRKATCTNGVNGPVEGDYFSLCIVGQGLEEIPVKLERKQARVRVKNKDVLKYSIKIEQVEDDDYYGFVLDGNHRYFMGDHTITHNTGSNSKSLLIDFFNMTIGQYAGTLPISLLTQRRGASSAATPELAQTRGKRFIYMQEPDRGEKMNIGLMKELTGGDSFMARPLFKDPFMLVPQFKIVLCCNDLPKVPPDDGGTWRRIRLVKFIAKFVDKPKFEYEYKIDRGLKDRMEEQWREVFMYKLVQKYQDYLKEGLNEPPEVMEATDGYQRNADILVDFLDDCVCKDTNGRLSVDELWFKFQQWFGSNFTGQKKMIASKNEFKTHLSRKLSKPDSKGGWDGIRFTNHNDELQEWHNSETRRAIIRDDNEENNEHEENTTLTTSQPTNGKFNLKSLGKKHVEMKLKLSDAKVIDKDTEEETKEINKTSNSTTGEPVVKTPSKGPLKIGLKRTNTISLVSSK